jgi:2-polyprenyl-3-methyl-5-hydroxy-6-metoxy-1,4-benzoquinol methylase
MEPEAIIGQIMERHGGQSTLEEFHHAVNVTFHEFESEVYDREHASMWESLPRQFALLVDDWLAAGPAPPAAIRLLDIGCGTGLATDSVLRTRVGAAVESVHLLDTAPSMLRRASERACQWKVPVTRQEGLLDSVSGEKRFDLIVTCSVLHHIPHLEPFLKTVRKLQADGGVFLHLQDPNGDSANDPELRQRVSQYSRRLLPDWAYRFTPRRVLGRIRRELTGKQGQDCVSRTIRALLERGIVKTPLTVRELFEITDIHVQDGGGISMARMKSWLPGYDCLSQRSYAFMGKLPSELPPRWRKLEDGLIAARALNGSHTGAIWKLRSAAK